MIIQNILQVAEALAEEKGIDREDVIRAVELSIQKAARAKYGFDKDIRASLDRESGSIQLTRCREVVEEVVNEKLEISLAEALYENKNIKIGDVLSEPLPPIDLGRVAAQTARQVIFQQVREAERMRQYDEFKNRVGENITGIVKRVEYGNIFVSLGKAEAILRRNDIIPRENFRVGDRIKAYVLDVRSDANGPQIFLSRTHPRFLIELFKQEVPEIYDGVIRIKKAVRDPGSRAKISVQTDDPTIDPVGCCVGMRGARVQAVVGELQGEKIDIIPWSENKATFIVNALIPAEVSKVILDEESRKVEVIVPEDDLSKAIGRRGQNVRLASQLTDMDLDVITESQESERREKQLKERSEIFIKGLDVDEVIARLLAIEGFSSIEDIAYVSQEELSSIEGFDEEIALELKNRASECLQQEATDLLKACEEMGVEEALVNLQGLTPKILWTLAQKGIRTRNGLADLSGEELLDLLAESSHISQKDADELIVSARSHWFSKK